MPNIEADNVTASIAPSASRVHVAVGVIENNKQEILIAKRPQHLHQGGLWEFPGGKVEKNETAQQALFRELNEELNIVVENAKPLISVNHDYVDKSVLLDVWLVDKFSGLPRGNESQCLQWVPVSELKNYNFPEANIEIIKILESKYIVLPDEIMITGDWLNLHDFEKKLLSAIGRGIKWVHLRSHTSSYDEYLELYNVANDLCSKSGAYLTANTSLAWYEQIYAKNLHFTSNRLINSVDRPTPVSVLFGVSCHNLDEILHAENIGADYIMLGPVFMTRTHPTQMPIGLERFSEWVKKTEIPVFALGGVSSEIKKTIKDAGGYGVAGISSYWKSS